MKRTMTAAIAMVGGMAFLLVVGYVMLVRFDGPGLTGTAIGAGLGLLNLAIGAWLARRALTRGMQSAMATLLSGFFVRLVLLAVLVLIFQRTAAVSEVAFALAFMILFFVFMGVEIFMVEKSLQAARRTA